MPSGVYNSSNRRGGVKGKSGVYPKSENHRKKISDTLKEKYQKGYLKSSFTTMRYWLGRKHTFKNPEERSRKISEARKKYFQIHKPWNWKEDRSLLKKQNRRNDPAYVDWRKRVWLRDNFKCRINNSDCSGRIEAHHILGWSKYPELRYEINNGITLCQAHHPRKRVDEQRLIPMFQELVVGQTH